MAQTKNIIEGMQILSKYTKDKYSVGAEHDVLYFYVEHDVPTPEDQARLDELGWHKSSESENWAVFT